MGLVWAQFTRKQWRIARAGVSFYAETYLLARLSEAGILRAILVHLHALTEVGRWGFEEESARREPVRQRQKAEVVFSSSFFDGLMA